MSFELDKILSFSSIKIYSLQRFSLNFSANIIAAFWMLLGSVRAFVWVKPSFAQFLCFLTTALLSNVLFAWLASDIGSQFNYQGLISYLVWPTIMLVAGMIIARRSQNEALSFVPTVLWLTADTLLMLVQSFIQFLGLQDFLPDWAYSIVPWLFTLLFVWQTASLLLVFAKRLYWNWWERLLMLIGAIALLVVWQKNVADQPMFKVLDASPSLSEEAFYAQPELLRRALLAINAGVAGVSEWYFLGVAGFGDQEVFASEIQTARQLFDVRFGTQGRSAALINNRYLWQDEPVATPTSIVRALNRIGEQMNSDEDVLFLVLSSHGAVGGDGVPTGELVIDNPPLRAKNIDGKWLKTALDESGIRWRVIVISACYSGAFIDDLASPTTAIITASRADRASFGCTNDADLTYFGRAFFDESMRHGDSFDKVFSQTKRRIAERESLRGLLASEPQIYIGSLMKTALPEFEKGLFGAYSKPDLAEVENVSDEQIDQTTPINNNKTNATVDKTAENQQSILK